MKLFSIQQAAIFLKTSPAKIRHWIKTDKSFPVVVYGERQKRIIAEKLPLWVESKMAINATV
ncbi:MAG: hypothetical protein LBD18_03340 [Treponema sp.]|jgi:hypothetical protein|nr:hypothetical protein [Treponema sp.]